MGMFSTINIAASGMSAERLRTDVIADNIANATTHRTQAGEVYRRKSVILTPMGDEQVIRHPFAPDNDRVKFGAGSGVRVREIAEDRSQGIMIYDPSHPDAYLSGPNQGYMEYPNVKIVNEMVDMISASRAYEANSSVIQGYKEMFGNALEIGR